jgi:hypothetical protein
MRFTTGIGSLALAAALMTTGAAHAVCPTDTCTTGATTRQCDLVCGFPTSAGNPCTVATNDCNSDGAKVTCAYAGGGGSYIVGGSGADVICGRSGDDTIRSGGGTDTINGEGGNDVIEGEGANDVIEGGTGADTIDGGPADDTIYGVANNDLSTDDGGNLLIGDNGDDTLLGAGGDDEILGGDGEDTILGQGGRDVLKGGDDDDTVASIYLGATPNDYLGTILCGGAGDDVIVADGAGHQCVDAGADQQVTGINDFDCTYANVPNDGDPHDIGTQRNCVNPGAGFSATRHPSCGCDTE